jgi:hypothetical protein
MAFSISNTNLFVVLSTLLRFPALTLAQDDVVPELTGNVIPWNQHDPLEWGDFMGTPNATSPHQMQHPNVINTNEEAD